MHAIILAAGIGKRIGSAANGKPKCLIEMGGTSLLTRHLRELAAVAAEHVTIVTGYREQLIREELDMFDGALPVSTIRNPDYEDGSIVSLWSARSVLSSGRPVLLMDADVLYHAGIMRKLCNSRHANCFLLDREFEAGNEPVKLCTRDGTIVEFRKSVAPGLAFDVQGESVGFFRFAPATAAALAQRAQRYLDSGRREAPYVEAIRDLVLDAPREFDYEDVTGIPWLEIDFPEDVARARRDILPRLNSEQH